MFGSRDDRAKVIEKATQLALRGNVARALATLKQHLAAHPDDDRVLLKLGDLQRRNGDDAAAAAAFAKAAELYVARGFTLKAAASLRQAVANAPADLALVEKLAEVNAALQLNREAAQGLEQVAAAVAQAGDRARVVALRRRILELLPGDANALLRLSDLLAQDGKRAEAASLLESRVGTLTEPSHAELRLLFQERLCALQPENVARARALAGELLTRASPKRALALLKVCFTADPASVETLSLLAQAFVAIGHLGKAGQTWREIAHVHQRAGRGAEATAAWRKVRELVPADAEAKVALTPPPLPPRKPDVQELIEEEQEELVSEEEERDSTTRILDRVPAEILPRVEEGAHRRDLAVAFLEMEMYEQAIAELEQAIAADPPREPLCLSLAGRCHLARGAPRDAVSAYRRALASPLLSFEGAAAVRYELGEALLALGEDADALEQFREVNRLEPGFRDVAKRIVALAGR